MIDVGVRELKQHLSEYLERASNGETVRVTDRGRPKAVLSGLPGRERVEEGIAEGWITPSTSDGLAPLEPVAGERSIQDALDQDRGA